MRNALLSGDLERANDFLGRPFSIEGLVVSGKQLGSQLGFPTANIGQLDPFKLKVEMFKFYRSIKLKYFYRKDNVQVYSPSNAPPLRE